MGAAIGNVWCKGHPELHECLECLRNWSREDVKEACIQFRSDKLAVNLSSFMRILRITNRPDGDAAYNALKNSKDRVEWFSAIAVMVLMSDQKYISKVTFLFSLCDFNSSREVNCAELCIGMRYLMMGISRFFKNATIPPRGEVEQSTVAVFSKIDADNTSFISIEEMVSFAYMSKDLRVLLSAFPANDQRIFEELISFYGTNSSQARQCSNMVEAQEQKMIRELRLTPDAKDVKQQSQRTVKRKCRDRPWETNQVITKPYAWLIYHFFIELKDRTYTIPSQTLSDYARDFERTRGLLTRLAEKGGPSLSANGSVSGHGSGQSLTLLAARIAQHLTDSAFLSRLELTGGDAVSVRALLCLCCNGVKEAEIDDGMRWCQTYRANDVLTELLKCKTGPMSNPADSSVDAPREIEDIDVDASDIDALFEALDTDGGGRLSLAELCQSGEVRPDEARRFVNLFDRDRSGDLSKAELLHIVHEVHSEVRQTMKAIFATTKRDSQASFYNS
jgi:Ca2+-binding EF-hand superfamily protein